MNCPDANKDLSAVVSGWLMDRGIGNSVRKNYGLLLSDGILTIASKNDGRSIAVSQDTTGACRKAGEGRNMFATLRLNGEVEYVGCGHIDKEDVLITVTGADDYSITIPGIAFVPMVAKR